MTAPAHLILGPPGHGVRVLATQLAAATAAETVPTWADAARHDRVHVHLTDGLAEVADVRRLASGSRVTVTLHDLPQPTDGPPFPRRRDRYRQLLAAADGWAVSSAHERRRVEEYLAPAAPGLVAPLPVVPARRDQWGAMSDLDWPVDWSVDWPAGRTVGIFGFLYPGKGHREMIAAAAALPAGESVTVMSLGAVAPGHDDLVADLDDLARSSAVDFRVTGHLDESAVTAALRRVDVGVCGHRNVSASGSTNQWLAAGRRPLVRDGRYARELAALRPGCYLLYTDHELPDRLTAALASPEQTWLGPDADTRPHLRETARAYLDWWAAASSAGSPARRRSR